MKCQSRPVFVLGTLLSGSSNLSWALSQHPNFIHALETEWLVKLASELEPLYEAGTTKQRSSHLVARSVKPPRFYEAFGDAVNEIFLSDDRQSSQTAPQRWVDCTPSHAFNIFGLLRLFPEAKFIHTFRDVNSVVRSLVNWTAPDGSTFNLESAYDHWRRTSKAILEAEIALGSEKIMRVNYRELFENPEGSLRDCLAFLDEPYSSDCLRIFAGLEYFPNEELSETNNNNDVQLDLKSDAEFLSDLLVPSTKYAPNPERAKRLDDAFSNRLLPTRTIRPNSDPLSLTQRVQDVARTVLPPNACAAVISKGDDTLLRLGIRKAGHFPQTTDGVYAGYHPSDSEEAIGHLEELRRRDHDFLVIPSPSYWWLNFYSDFREHLYRNYDLVFYKADTCMVFSLQHAPTSLKSKSEVNLLLRI